MSHTFWDILYKNLFLFEYFLLRKRQRASAFIHFSSSTIVFLTSILTCKIGVPTSKTHQIHRITTSSYSHKTHHVTTWQNIYNIAAFNNIWTVTHPSAFQICTYNYHTPCNNPAMFCSLPLFPSFPQPLPMWMCVQGRGSDSLPV